MNAEASAVSKDNQKPSPGPGDKSALNARLEDEPESVGAGWRETFRMALDRARRQQKPRESRQELGRDRTKALVVLVALGVVLLLLFFGLFSSPNKPAHLPGENPHGQPSLGQKLTPGQETSPNQAVTPLLSADVRANDPNTQGQLTPEDVDRTSRTAHLAKPSPTSGLNSEPQDYALRRVDFSDPLAGESTTEPAASPLSPSRASDDAGLKKPSLVYVRSTQSSPAVKTLVPEPEEETLVLPAGTRLLARLQAPVSSAVAMPAVAVIEYNYERDGRIVMPAGAKVLGRLAQVSPSGDVAIQFSQVEMPDGTAEKLEASAMDLNFKPLKGYVSGKNTGTKFLVRSLTGLGTVATYLVGPQASSSAGLISTNVLMRERLADNIATAGQEELNGFAFNPNLVVTVPGNTRVYIVLQKPTSSRVIPDSLTANTSLKSAVPTLDELRQLIQLRHEINSLYAQQNGQPAVQASPQR